MRYHYHYFMERQGAEGFLRVDGIVDTTNPITTQQQYRIIKHAILDSPEFSQADKAQAWTLVSFTLLHRTHEDGSIE